MPLQLDASDAKGVGCKKGEPEIKERKIARRPLSPEHLLNVVFSETESEIIVVTFYTGRRTRYEGTI